MMFTTEQKVMDLGCRSEDELDARARSLLRIRRDRHIVLEMDLKPAHLRLSPIMT